jgi:hypothetical protein
MAASDRTGRTDLIDVVLKSKARAVLDQAIGKIQPPTREHREVVVGTEGVFGDQQAPAAPSHLFDRDHSEPQLEAKLPGGEAPGRDQRRGGGSARRGRDQEGCTIASEHERQLHPPGWR